MTIAFCGLFAIMAAVGLLMILPTRSEGRSSAAPEISTPAGATYRCDADAGGDQEPLWVSRCYEGEVTLANYDSAPSRAARAESNRLWSLAQKMAGFQSPDASGQWIDAEQSAVLLLFLLNGGHLGWAHDVAPLTDDIRQTGPVIQGKGLDTHQRVRIYYSDGVVEWLQGGRSGEIPDGEMIVKQMYSSDPADSTYGADRTTGWAVMVRNRHLSKDGWLWYLFFFPQAPPYDAPAPVAYGQVGDNFCLSCHAAADNDALTFVALDNLSGASQQYIWIDHTFPGLFASSPTSRPRKQRHTATNGTDETDGAGEPSDTDRIGASGVGSFQSLGQAAAPLWLLFSQHRLPNAVDLFRQELGRLEAGGEPRRGLHWLRNLFHPGWLEREEDRVLALAAAGERITSLFEKLKKDVEQDVDNHDPGAILNAVMQTYLRLPTQIQSYPHRIEPNRAIVEAFGAGSPVELPKRQADLPWFPLDFIFSHTPALPESACGAPGDGDCRDVFITSDNCNGCHWSYVLEGEALPHMIVAATEKPSFAIETSDDLWDVSPYSEWSASMMGLAGRDPIFHVQLEWEQAHHPKQSAQIPNLCLRCHQAGAQRQFHLDQGDSVDPATIAPPGEPEPSPLFDASYSYLEPSSRIDAAAKYGALGRDGITCTVCHQIEATGLGDPSTFSGQFHFPTQPGPIYGPFPDDQILPYLMEQSIGLTPTYGPQITESALCGSCHTLMTPILSEPPEGGAYRSSYEQTTFPEWLNSSFSRPGGRSCQDCHMPSHLPDQPASEPISAVIANVETAFLPRVDTRAADALITPSAKEPYRRHTLVGMNLFANQMFQQFPNVLGNAGLNPGGMPNAYPSLVLAEQEMLYLASEATATIAIDEMTAGRHDDYRFAVTVENLVGHKFPSGVGFRRAFVELSAYDRKGARLWSSGSTNEIGQIVNTHGRVLASETTDDPLKIPTGAPTITSDDDVYIFEERTVTWKDGEARDPGEDRPPLDQMMLTTSFLEIVASAKDTRLLPKGWRRDGPYAEFTVPEIIDRNTKQPVPYIPELAGVRTITYTIPRHVGHVARVEAVLHYQSIPPHYIQDRLQYDTQAARSFYYMVSHLETKGTSIERWTVDIAHARHDRRD